MSDEIPDLYWDSTYAIAVALMEIYPTIRPDEVGLHQLNEMVEALPGFKDDPALATERILHDIHIVWYEEAANQ